jgi:DNA-directed RNA polymerase subunit RPC12/RpoP
VIRRSEYGPACPHCGHRNDAEKLSIVGGGEARCIYCGERFFFRIEHLPFYVTDDGAPLHCDCPIHTPPAEAA